MRKELTQITRAMRQNRYRMFCGLSLLAIAAAAVAYGLLNLVGGAVIQWLYNSDTSFADRFIGGRDLHDANHYRLVLATVLQDKLCALLLLYFIVMPIACDAAYTFGKSGSRPRAAFPYLSIAALTLLAVVNRFIQDDALISFRYADNLVQGLGLVYNAGERIEAYTNFLWVLILSAGMYLKMDAIIFSWCVSLVCFVVCLVLTHKLFVALFRSESYALLCVLLLGLNYTFSAYATSGLETMFVTMLVMLVARCVLIISLGQERTTTFWLLGAAASLAMLARMDSFIFAALAYAYVFFLCVVRRRGFVRFIYACTLPLILCGCWLLFKVSYYGDILPNSYHVKLGTSTSLARGLRYVDLFFRQYGLYPFCFGAFLIGLSRRKETSVGQRAGLLLATVVAWIGYTVKTGGDFMEFRMFVPIMPMIFILVCGQVFTAVRGPVLKVAFALSLVFMSYVHAKTFEPHQRFITDSVKDLDRLVRGGTVDQLSVGKRMNELFGDYADVRLAVAGAGTIPYYSRLPAVDIQGLTDKWVAKNAPIVSDVPGHQRAAPLEYLMERGVDIVVGNIRTYSPEDRRDSFSIHEAGPMTFGTVTSDNIPDSTRILEVPLADQRYFYLLCVSTNELIDRVAEQHGLRFLQFDR